MHELTNAGSGDRRAGVHRVQDPGSGLFRQRRTQLVGGPGPPLDVGREQRVIVLGQRRRLPGPGSKRPNRGGPSIDTKDITKATWPAAK